MRNIGLVLLGIIMLNACGKDDQEKIEQQFVTDIQLIEQYIQEKNLQTQKTSDGIYYIIENEGTEIKPKVTSTVVANYKGYFLDGEVFDEGENISFALYNVIEGWQKTIPKFGKGGKGKLIIPSKFGYGESSTPGRANAVLVFDIEVVDF